jgi:FKBP-type peptidyl-prolyl cis-trans isomerase
MSLAAPGWRELLLDMGVGERRMVWMPSQLATSYSAGGQEILVMVVDLIGIKPAPKTPEHLHAPPSDATATASGRAYQVLQPGTGSETPALWDKVSLHYHIWTEDGLMLRTTSARQSPEVTQLYYSPKAWAEAVQTLVVGQTSRFWIPQAAREPLKAEDPGGMQVADIELVSLERQPAPPDVPGDVARPPDNAQKTDKGVFYVVLTEGTGTVHPTVDSQVKVHYTGWTTDGTMFDSSVVRGKPTIFPLQAVIPGWTDVLQVMVAGQKIRAWIPEKLAYEGKPNRPQGMLVFEIELLAVVGR